MQIVDAHHHLWDLGKLHYPWLAEPIDHPMGDYAAIRRNYLIGDFRADAARLELVKSVHVQAEVDHADPVAETAWLQAVAGDPASGGLVELYLQASLADPYVGLRLEDGTLIEPSLDSPLDLYVQDDVIRASAIRFVRDLNLDTGEAADVGFGKFEIHCYSYEREPLP